MTRLPAAGLPLLLALGLGACGGHAVRPEPAAPAPAPAAPAPPSTVIRTTPATPPQALQPSPAAPDDDGTQVEAPPFACIPMDKYRKLRQREADLETARNAAEHRVEVLTKDLDVAMQQHDTTPPPPVEDVTMGPVLGRNVVGVEGDKLGRIVDVLTDKSGRTRAAIVEFGGFLGVGNRRVAVAWSLLNFVPSDPDQPVMLWLNRKQIEAAPTYTGPDAVDRELVQPPGAPSPAPPPDPATDR